MTRHTHVSPAYQRTAADALRELAALERSLDAMREDARLAKMLRQRARNLRNELSAYQA